MRKNPSNRKKPFTTRRIKTLLTGKVGALEHFSVQAELLEQKANALLDASKALKNIICDVEDDKSIPWKAIIQIIEVYRMTQQLEHSWVKEIFTPEELKQYAAFEAEMKSHSLVPPIKIRSPWLIQNNSPPLGETCKACKFSFLSSFDQ